MTQTLALILFLFPLAYSPGPGNMLFAANGARFGWAATLPASCGYHVATWGVTCAIGFGFGGLTVADPRLALTLRVVGGAYVLWLAWGLWRAEAPAHGADARALGFLGGAWLLLVNPKAYVIIALMFSQFLPSNDWHAVIWISTVFTLNNALAFGIWAALGDRLARRLRDPAHLRAMNRGLAMVLAAVALWMMAA